MRKIFSLLSILLIFPLFSVALLPSASTNSIVTMYQHYSSTLKSNPSGITYTYSYAFHNTTSSQQQITYTRYSFDVAKSSLENFTGLVKVAVKPFNITVYSQIPQLARVLLIEPGFIQELVWAGFTNSSATVSGLAYFNSSAKLVLEYLNGSSFANVTINISHGETYSESLTLLLYHVNLSLVSEAQVSITVQATYPERYHKIEFVYQGTSSEANYNTTVAYYNDTYVPAMIWSTQASGYFSIDRLDLEGNVEFTAIELFGINGTVLAYLDNHFFSNYINTHGIFVQNKHDSVSSDLKIVLNPSAKYSKATVSSTVMVKGNPVVIVITNKGVESSAEINLSHQVYVVTPANLVLVNVTNGQAYVLVFNNGTSEPVRLVSPSSVVQTNVTIGGKSYTAQEVSVNSSGYITFNVSMMNNESVTVFKQTSSGLVELNSNNYFVYNGKVVVFDDPSTTYYIVYGYTQSKSFTFPIFLVLVIVVVIVVALVLFMLKRKK